MFGSSSTIRIFVFISGLGQRHFHHETTATARARFVANITAVSARNLAGERQSQPGALNAAAQGIVRAIKLFENLLLAAARDAGAAVEHTELHGAPTRFGVKG